MRCSISISQATFRRITSAFNLLLSIRMATSGTPAFGAASLLPSFVSDHVPVPAPTTLIQMSTGLMGWCCPCFLFGRTQSRLKGVRDPDLFGVNSDVSPRTFQSLNSLLLIKLFSSSAAYGVVFISSVVGNAFTRQSSVSTCVSASASKEVELQTGSHHAAAPAVAWCRKRRSHCSNRRPLMPKPPNTTRQLAWHIHK